MTENTDKRQYLQAGSESQNFTTQRNLNFFNEKEQTMGFLKIEIKCEDIVTDEMARNLNELATETLQRAKGIIEGQKAPQQFF